MCERVEQHCRAIALDIRGDAERVMQANAPIVVSSPLVVRDGLFCLEASGRRDATEQAVRFGMLAQESRELSRRSPEPVERQRIADMIREMAVIIEPQKKESKE